jgi:hypothetical protein
VTTKLISREELSKLLNVSLSVVDRGKGEGKWPFNRYVKIGRKIYFNKDLIEQEVQEASRTGKGVPEKETKHVSA